MSKKRIALIVLAVAAVALSLFNASWLAPAPRGKLQIIAHRGVAQPFDRAAEAGCTATGIRAPEHNYIENTIFSMQRALALGADVLAVEVQPTADGQMVVFGDATLDCRTDGAGPVATQTLAELKALDAGHGYTADRGATFPLRGRGVGAIPTVEEVLRGLPTASFIFLLGGSDPRQADMLIAAFQRAGMAVDERHGFAGDPAVTARVKQLAPDAWTFDPRALGNCLGDYTGMGWAGVVPPSCRGTTIGVPLEGQWRIWGWPKRFLARIAGADSKVIMAASHGEGGIIGIERPDQLAEVPRAYRGYLWVEDMYTVGRSLQR